MSEYYAVSGAPVTGSQGLSSIMRAEFALISAGLAKLPTMAGAENKFVVVNSAGTALTTTVAPSFYYNVQSYGATGDGVTDDYTALQTVLTLVAASGGTMYFPRGRYLINTGLSLGSAAEAFELAGDGMYLSTIVRGDLIGTPINIHDCSNWGIRDLGIDANFVAYPTNANHGISFYNASYVTIARVFVTDWMNSAILGYTSPDAPSSYSHNLLDNCLVDGLNNANNGVLFVNFTDSGYINTRAINIGKAGSPCYALQFKESCLRCYMIGGFASGATVGIACGNTGAGGDGAMNGTIRGVEVYNCVTGMTFGNSSGYVVDGILIDNVNDASSLYGVDFGGNSWGNSIRNLCVRNMLSPKTAVKFRSGDVDNTVHISTMENSSGLFTIAAEFLAGALRNQVTLDKYVLPTAVTKSTTLCTNSGGPTNTFVYNDLPMHTLPTIATGVISLRDYKVSQVLIANEAAAASDDLDTISDGVDGQVIILQTASDVQDVVVKHNTGNIWLNSLEDFTLSTKSISIVLVYRLALLKWVELSCSMTKVTARGSTTTRALPDRFDETVNPYDYGAVGDGVTTDQTAVAAAVADAYAAGKPMYWPVGTFLTTATIPNFHDVRHRGPGIVKRSSTLFYVEPKRGQQNNLYVSTAGNDANDGLTTSQPTLTLQQAIDNLNLYTPLLGHWIISMAAGTYAEAAVVPDHTSYSDDYLEIFGVQPSAGTASGATTNAAGYAVGVTTVTLASAGTGTIIVGDTIRFATASTASGATTNAAGYAIGATVITLAATGTGSLVVGDIITFAGNETRYKILVGDADVSGGGTFTVTPPLVYAIPAAATAITVVQALHRVTLGDADVSNGGSITFTPGLNIALPASAVAISQVTTNRAIPTVIMDVPGGGGLFAINCGRHNRMKVSYIKCTNWTAANSGLGGINASDDSVLWTYNCHIFKCREGIVGNNCQMYISGGIIEGNTWTTGSFPSGGGTNGVVIYSGARCSLSYGATNEETGTLIMHWLGAGYHGKARVHTVSTWCTFQSNENAIYLYTDSRFDDRTNIFRKNVLCYYSQSSMFTSDQLLGASQYNFGQTYDQTPNDSGVGTAAGATTNAAGYAVGARNITLAAAGAGTINIGDRITFAGDTTEYRVTGGDTDVSGGGTVYFAPPLVAIIAAAPTAITVVPTWGNGNFGIWKYLNYSSCEEFVPLYGIGALDVARSRTTTTQTGAVASTLMRTLTTIPRGALAVNSEFNYYEVHLVGAATGSVGAAKTVLVKLNGITMATLTVATGTQAWSARLEIWNTSSYAQVICNTTAFGGATVAQQRLSPIGMDAWADQDLEVWGTTPGAADTLVLHETRVIKWG